MHAIDMSNNRANIAFVGETPWHGLGQSLSPGQPLEVWCKEAGLDWEAMEADVMFYDSREKRPVRPIVGFPKRKVLYRSDNGHPLSIVSNQYQVLQPRDVLEFFRDLVSDAGFEMETAGSLYDGEKIWALARTNNHFRVLGQDELRGYLLLATSFDGTMQTVARFTSVRVVCNNTLQVSLRDGSGAQVKVPHSTRFNEQQVKQLLGITQSAWAEFEEVANTLAERKVSRTEARDWLISTFGDPNAKDDEQPNMRIIKGVWDSVRKSPGANLRSADGTAWGLVNGATHYFDFMRRTRTNDARFNGGQFGTGANYKQKALQNALKLVA
jgi:phage/plasmid-like protein (TIGR03299 family)